MSQIVGGKTCKRREKALVLFCLMMLEVFGVTQDSRLAPMPIHPKRALEVHILNRWYLTSEAPHSPPLRQSSSSSSSGTKMSCSSSSAAKFLLIWVPTYKKGTTTRAILIRPKGVCRPGVTHHHRNSYIRLPQAAPGGTHLQAEGELLELIISQSLHGSTSID